MGRVNKTIEGAFIDIVGGPTEMSEYDKFLQNTITNPSEVLSEMTTEYEILCGKHKHTFERLSLLEEIILQLRIREDLSDVKLSMVRDYIYARTPFYRKNRDAKDIRVIVDKASLVPELSSGAGIEILYGNEEFMNQSRRKLGDTMDNEIRENIQQYRLMYK